MIHELREYTFQPAQWPAYRRLFETLCLPIRGHDHGVLIGSWMAEEAHAVRFLHLWGYSSLDARAALRARLAAIPAWSRDFLPQARVLVQSQTLSALHPQTDTPLPDAAGHALVLHRYRCAVGRASALATRLRTVQRMQPGLHGVWTTEFADPNEVVLLADAQVPSPIDATDAIDGEAAFDTSRSLPLIDLGHRALLALPVTLSS